MFAEEWNAVDVAVRHKSWSARAAGFASRSVLLAGILAFGGVAFAQSTMTDAQVEANVLKALAGAPDLASQTISTKTVYGVVTLSGNVQTEAARVEAENLAANANGVKKVVDELQVGAQAVAQDNGVPEPQGSGQAGGPGPGMVLQSDGTYAPATSSDTSSVSPAAAPAPGSAPASGAVMNDPDHDQAQYAPDATAGTNGQSTNGQPMNGQVQNAPAPYGQPQGTPEYDPNGTAGTPPPAYGNGGQPSASQNGYPAQNGYPQQNRYPQQNGYPAYPQGGYPQNGPTQPWGGQVAGEHVTVPAGTMVRMQVNRLLASNKLHPGDVFDGFAANDVVAGGFVAIPRGAAIQGRVVDAKSSGAISGRGELSMQLVSVTLGGKTYPLSSDTWARSGPDKTGQTVGNAAGFGVAGALIGAIAGRGAGAAIGAGVGAAAGVGASAASPRGQVVIPPEGMLTFHLTQPTEMKTVSEQEIQRLAYGVPAQAPRRPMYARPYPGYGYPPPPPPYGYPAY